MRITTTLTANVTAEPDVKYSKNGRAYIRLNLASSAWKKCPDGTFAEGETTWISATVFGKLAEHCADVLRKGSKVLVFGTLESRSWENNTTGVKGKSLDMTVDEIGLIPTGRWEQAFIEPKVAPGKRAGAAAPAQAGASQYTVWPDTTSEWDGEPPW